MELRWDGMPSLADALRMLKEQAQRIPPEWVPVVGGWTEFQFAERRMPTLEVFQNGYGPPQRLPLTLFMSDKEPVWNRLVKKHSLLDYTFQEAAAWKQ